jgi:hypothetical protein
MPDGADKKTGCDVGGGRLRAYVVQQPLSTAVALLGPHLGEVRDRQRRGLVIQEYMW